MNGHGGEKIRSFRGVGLNCVGDAQGSGDGITLGLK